ncbi:MAG: hypothetical protein H7338_24575 [Candidatus Sericytochromatia bacterium]|nr:hypothetical protein [Candidatus Sericytochromatia bacterium]
MGKIPPGYGDRRSWWQGLTVAILLGLALPAAGARVTPYVFFVAGAIPHRIVDWQICRTWPPDQRQAAVPCGLRLSIGVPPEAVIQPFPPYAIGPTLPVGEQAALREIAEDLRICPTGRVLYGYLRRSFGPLSGSDRSLLLRFASMGGSGDMAVTSGRPPHYVITLNRDLLDSAGSAALVAKLGHEIVHVHDYACGVQRSVAMEVSAHAADAAIAYEANMLTSGKPLGAFSNLISLPGVYETLYLPFRTQPTAESHNAYWQKLLAFVLEERPYAQLYRNEQGQTIWNSPPGPVSDETYVPYDPAFGWPEDP